MAELELRCRCGKVRGAANGVTPDNGTRLICMCDDCQTYAHFLGRSADMLDRNGGTEVYQTAPVHLSLEAGEKHIRCVRQHRKGLMRWYAGCCNTPLFNGLASARAPFTGILRPFYDHNGEDAIADAIGPIRARTQARWGFGELPSDAHRRAPVSVILHSLRVLGTAWWQGAHRPNPLFTSEGAPLVQPTVLTPDQRAALKGTPPAGPDEGHRLILFGELDPDREYVHRPGSYAVIFDDDGRLLTVREESGWYLPGGGVEPGESPLEALHREVVEETGMEVAAAELTVRARQLVVTTRERAFDKDCFVYRATLAERTRDSDCEVQWMDVEEAIESLAHESLRWAVRQVAYSMVRRD